MLKLHPLPSDGRFYCGPAAIAAFTGLHPKKEVRAAINVIRGRKSTQGVVLMQCHEVADTLTRLGFRCARVPVTAGTTLKDFVARHPGRSFVVNVTGHFVAVSDGMCLDNKSLIARPVALFPGNRKVVKRAILVFQKEAVT